MPGRDKTRIIVLGGGPAGSATAIALMQAMAGERGALDLTLFDARCDPLRPIIGETIPPAATPVLRSLGLLPLLECGGHLVCPGSISVWGSEQPGYNDFLMQPVGRGYHLDRAGFDADLLERAGSLGCRLEPGWHLRSVKVQGQGYRLGFSPSSGPAAGQITRWAEADFVVDASGIGAAFARRLGVARNRFDEVISLCALYRLPEDGDGAPAYTLVQTGELGWWYATRLPHRKAIVSLCTDAETLKQDGLAEPAAWHRAFSASGWLARECRRQFGARLGVPGRLQPKAAPSAILSAVVGERWLAVGDAASSYDSMSSAGITKALIHAGMAGKALADWLRDGSRSLLDAYQTRVFDDFNTYLSLHQAHYRSETGYPRSGFWRRRRM